MPIKGMTDRNSAFPRIGVLRKGAPRPEDGKRPGTDLKHFRFDTQDASAARAFVAVYGAEPNNIRVYLPYCTADENLQSWREEWSASSLIRRCDGCEIVIRRNGQGYNRTPTPCIAPNCACKPTGRLAVIVQELRRLAYVEVQTTSINDIIELTRNLQAVESLRGDLRGIPFVLSRKPRMISMPDPKTGERVRREKWLLSIEPAPDWVALQLSAMQRAALPMESPLELDAPVAEDEAEVDGIRNDEHRVIEPDISETQKNSNGNGIPAHAETNGKRVEPLEPIAEQRKAAVASWRVAAKSASSLGLDEVARANTYRDGDNLDTIRDKTYALEQAVKEANKSIDKIRSV